MSGLRWALGYVKRIKVSYIGAFVLLVVFTLGDTLLIGVQKFLVDNVLIQKQYDQLLPLLVVFAVAIVIQNGALFFGNLTFLYNEYRVRTLILVDLLKSLHRIPMPSFQKERTGAILHTLTRDSLLMSNLLTNFFPRELQHTWRALFYCSIIGYLHAPLLIVVFIVSVVYVAAIRYFAPKLKRMSEDIQTSRAGLLVHIEEGVSASREVIAFDRIDWERQKYHSLFDALFAKILQEGRLLNKSILSSDFMHWIAYFIVIGYGGMEVYRGTLSVGSYIILIQYTSVLLYAVEGMYNLAVNTASRYSSLTRVKQVIDSEEMEDGDCDLSRVEQLRFDRVTFRYIEGTRPVLDQMNLDFPIGRKIAFVGMSGGGKSTIGQLLIRFFDPQEGNIVVNHMPLTQISRAAWQRQVCCVLQDPYLFPDSIRNNVLMGRDYTESEMIRAAQLAEIDEHIQTLPQGYDSEIGERGILLSGGQRQRIALARAMLANPDILILDEATSALDLETERRVQANIDHVRSGNTTIIIAHRLSTIQNADIIYVLDQGAVVESGTHETLMLLNGVYTRLVAESQKQDGLDAVS